MINYPNVSLYQAFKQAADKSPNETAIFYYRNRISFAKLDSLINTWASILQNDFGIKKGDSIIISLPNIPQTLILFYAINKIGAISNMVHPYAPMQVMQQYYDESNAKLAFLFDRRVLKELKAYKGFNGNIVICEWHTYLSKKTHTVYNNLARGTYKLLQSNSKFSFYRNFKENGLEAVEVPLKDNEVSVLLHSASTTGESKTIMLSGKSFNYTASHVTEIMCETEDELVGKAMVSILPAFHGFGLCMTMHAPLANQFGVVLIPSFSPSFVSKMIKRVKVAISICGVPTVYKGLLAENSFRNNRYLKNLRSCFSGGDSLPSSVKENFDALMIKRRSNCRLFEGYGLTEALSVCVVNTHRHHKFGSVGYPLDGVEVKILDENNNEVEAGTVGEIAIRCGNSMLGYYQNEKATQEAYFGEFLKTGDMGYLDEDGFLFFNSRKKRVIKVSGVAVFPHEIEEVISHIPGVKGVCAIQIPDEKMTHAVKVFVVSDNKNPEIILDECRKHLISWAIPKEVQYVSKLPYTKYKKVNFTLLQQQEDRKRGLIA